MLLMYLPFIIYSASLQMIFDDMGRAGAPMSSEPARKPPKAPSVL
jgi:hypothetical protein